MVASRATNAAPCLASGENGSGVKPVSAALEISAPAPVADPPTTNSWPFTIVAAAPKRAVLSFISWSVPSGVEAKDLIRGLAGRARGSDDVLRVIGAANRCSAPRQQTGRGRLGRPRHSWCTSTDRATRLGVIDEQKLCPRDGPALGELRQRRLLRRNEPARHVVHVEIGLPVVPTGDQQVAMVDDHELRVAGAEKADPPARGIGRRHGP